VLRSIDTAPGLQLRLAHGNVLLPLERLSEEDIATVLAEAQTGYGSVRVTDSGADNSAWLQFYGTWAEAMRAQLATQPEHISVPMAALLINDDVWLHLPGEVFTALGQAIAARSPFSRTVVTTLFGPFIGYLPDPEDFTAGGYAATLVPRILQMPPYSPAVGDALVDGAVTLLESLES
jgi:hypothetical protein